MANTINENWIFNASELHWKLTLWEINGLIWTPSEKLRWVNSVYSTVETSSDNVNNIIGPSVS